MSAARKPVPAAPASQVRAVEPLPVRSRSEIIAELDAALVIRSRAIDHARARLAARSASLDAWVYQAELEQLTAGMEMLKSERAKV